MIIMFFVFPQREESWWMFGLYGLFAGMFISWSAPNNNAILSDVFPEATFPLAYGVAQLAEGSVSAWAPFAVAVIAEKVFDVGELQNFDCKSDEEKEDDARGLSLAIFSVCCVGWGLCGVVVTGFYFYYPSESRSLQETATSRLSAGSAEPELSPDNPSSFSQELPVSPSRADTPGVRPVASRV